MLTHTDESKLRIGPAKSAADPLAIVQFGLQALLWQWFLLPVPVLVGVLLGVGAMYGLGRQSWEASGTMLYTSPPVSDAHRGLYSPPDLVTLIPFAKSPDLLESLAADFELSVPATLLEKLTKVTIPKGTHSVVVTVQWSERDKAIAMTDRLMALFIERCREFRRQKMNSYITDLSARVRECDDRHRKASEELQRRFRERNVIDVATESDALKHMVETFQITRSNALRDEAAVLAQRERLLSELEAFRKGEEESEKKARQYEASMESVSDARRRQDRIRELIADEKQRQMWMAELSAKRREFDRLTAALEKGAISPHEMDTISKEIEILTAKLTDSQQTVKLKEELAKIDQTVVPKGKGASTGSPIVHQALFRKLELDLRLTGIAKELSDADKGLADCRRRQTDIQILSRQSEGITRDLESIEVERRRLNDQLDFFKRLRDQQTSELAVVSPARSPAYPASSNRKTMFMGGCLAGVVIALSLAFWRQWHVTFHGGRSASESAGVIILGTVGADDIPSQRLAISAIRDWQPAYGTIITTCSDGSGLDPLPWTIRIARRLAARDERVLIADCRIGEMAVKPALPAAPVTPPSQPTTEATSTTTSTEAADTATPPKTETALAPWHEMSGLGNLLRFEFESLEELTATDEHSLVEVLPAGTAPSLDVLASQRMKVLLDESRKKYSLIFLIGPDVQCIDGIDLLLRLSDGAIAYLSPKAKSRTLTNRLRALTQEWSEEIRGIVLSSPE